MNDEPFWEVWDFDEKDNTIYSHPGWWGEDECGPYRYLLTTMLIGDKIHYHLTHEQFEDVDEYLGSLDEAEDVCEDCIESEKNGFKIDDDV